MDGPEQHRESDRGPNALAGVGRVQPLAWVIGIVLLIALAAGAGFFLTRNTGASLGGFSRAPSNDVKSLQQALATAQKSDEVSRAANTKLQDELAKRDAEIATLKEDLAFYERFVGTSAQRQPLGVEMLKFTRRGGQVWQFAAVVARSNAANEEVSGRLSFSIEGTQNGSLKKLGWSDLRQGAGSDGVPFSLKYFQRLSGEFVLPADFTPTRVTARLVPKQGAPVEASFAWKDVAF